MTGSTETLRTVRSLSQEGYKYGFITDIEAEAAPPGLNEDTVRFISAKRKSRNGYSNGGSPPSVLGAR